MTQKDKVLGLFGFLMDLLDEPSKTIETPKEVDSDKVLTDPSLPHHQLLNPYKNKSEDKYKDKSKDKILEMMGKIDKIDKERATQLSRLRTVRDATKPFIAELEQLKANGIKNAVTDKEKEELETIVGENSDKLGVTLENGKVRFVEVPNELRDNIPLKDGELTPPIGVNVKKTDLGDVPNKTNPNEIESLESLPKGVKEKFEEAIKKPMTRDTGKTPPTS